jgi:hypothetical protein
MPLGFDFRINAKAYPEGHAIIAQRFNACHYPQVLRACITATKDSEPLRISKQTTFWHTLRGARYRIRPFSGGLASSTSRLLSVNPPGSASHGRGLMGWVVRAHGWARSATREGCQIVGGRNAVPTSGKRPNIPRHPVRGCQTCRELQSDPRKFRGNHNAICI